MTTSRTSMSGPAPGANRINVASLLAGFALGAVLASIAWVGVVPETGATSDASGLSDFVLVDGPVGGTGADDGVAGPQTRVIQRGDAGGAAGGDVEGGASVEGGGAGGSGGGSGGTGGSGGGGSAPGVSSGKIKLGATYVSGGLACSFLCEVRDAMEAVRSRVNRGGGIHGRQLEIDYKPDDWDPQLGRTFIENLINDQVFAFAVAPSSEGLNAASKAGLFAKHGVPVVGADGLNNTQFTDPWIWPVATATTTNVHIIMKDAWDRSGGKLQPAIVFGNTYRFGVEGAYAFNQAYKRLSGNDIPGFGPQETGCKKDSRYCGIAGNENQYPTQTDVVEKACGSECNFLLLLLEPKTAQNWMNDFGIAPSKLTYGMAGAQPLFTKSFGNECAQKCEGMRVWTGYKPPVGEFESEPAVARYTQELLAQKGSADVFNQFSLGGYIGMELLVQALEKVGPDLTREHLVEALNSLLLKTGLTAASELRWTEDQRYANHSAHGYEMTWAESSGSFSGFVRATGYIKDPWLGQDNKLP